MVLLEGQGIHVAPQQNGRSRLAGVEIGDHGRGRFSQRDVEPESGERIEDPLLGPRELETQLRIGMDAPAQLDRVGVEGGGGGVGCATVTRALVKNWRQKS